MPREGSSAMNVELAKDVCAEAAVLDHRGSYEWGLVIGSSIGAMGSHPQGGQAAGTPGWSAHPPHTTAHSSRSPPNPATSIPQRQEGESPPYNTRGSGLGRERSNQPADTSRTTPYGAFRPTRLPQHEAQYSHPSQVQGSLSSQRQENTLDGGSSRLSGGRDSSSSPSVGATASHPWGGQPTGAPPGWSAHPAHRVLFPPSLHQNF
jgi:hypothetical protein